MSLCVPSAGALAILERFRVSVFVGWPKISLYVNDLVPNIGSVLADFLPAPGDALGGPQLVPFLTPAFINPDGRAEIDAAPVVWTNTGKTDPFTVYGYFVTDSSEGILLWAERLPAKTLIASPGQQIIWQPTLTLTSEYQ
jgi:hypothetical protein